MTKKDHAIIAAGFASAEAALFNDSQDPIARQQLADVLRFAARRVADELTAENPRFNWGAFEIACFPLANAKLKAQILAKVGTA